MTRRITVRSGSVPRKVIPPASAASAAGADTDAIHDNVASEISAITAKATPDSGDFLIIEDSAAANVKKSVTVGDLPDVSDHATPIATHAALPNAHHNEAHTIVSHSDTTATGAELETLTDGSETALHSHAGAAGAAFSELMLIGA